MSKQISPLIVVGEVLIMIGAIFWCITIIGAIWGVPMIIRSSKRIKGEMEVTIGHIVIAFLFFGFIGSILSLIGMIMDQQ